MAGKGVFGDGGQEMNKYQKLHGLSGWACLAYSEHMVLPAKTIYLLAGEARVLLAERDRLLAKRDRVVELLRQVGNSRDELWESGHDELFENIEALLREMGGE